MLEALAGWWWWREADCLVLVLSFFLFYFFTFYFITCILSGGLWECQVMVTSLVRCYRNSGGARPLPPPHPRSLIAGVHKITRINSSTRWSWQTRLTNSWTGTHESWQVRCSPCTLGFSRDQSTFPRIAPTLTVLKPNSPSQKRLTQGLTHLLEQGRYVSLIVRQQLPMKAGC